MKKAVSIKKRSAALALSGAMGISCLAGALAVALTGNKSVVQAASNVINVDTSMQYQTFDGWGTTLAWWANECGDWTREHSSGSTQRDYIMQLLFGEEGLNFNIARYNIGGGDNPEHSHLSFDTDMPGFQKERGGAYDWERADGTDKHWSETVDARQLWCLDAFQKIRKDVAEKNGTKNDAITEFFSNSPPYWMTYSGCASGSVNGSSDNLKSDYYEDYANYFVDTYLYLIRQGFTVDLLQPFNESGASNWKANGDQEGCHFDASTKTKVLALILKKLEERGLTVGVDVGYNWGDECDTGTAVNQYNEAKRSSGGSGRSGAQVVTGADKITYHIYGYDIKNAQQMFRFAKANGQQAEMSEITWTVSGTYDPNLMDTALQKYSQSIIDIVKYGAADSYVFWQGMENLTGLIKTGWNYGLLHGVYDNPARPSTVSGYDLASRGLVYQDVRTCKSYYVSGQYTKYIQPGYHMIECSDNRGMAAVSPDGHKLVIVKENNGPDKPALTFNLNNFAAESITKIYTDASNNWKTEEVSFTPGNNKFSDTVTPYSVTTYVIEGTSKSGSAHIIDESAAVNKDSFSAMVTEINKRGDKEGLFTAGSWGDGGQNDYNSYGGRTVYNSGTGSHYVAVRFYGTGFGILGERKSDSANLKYWCDPDVSGGSLPTTATGSVDTTNSTHLYKQQILRVNGLEEKWHTVYIQTVSGYLNLDGVFVINGTDNFAAAEAPSITDVAAKDGKIYVTFNKITDATLKEYSVEYRKDGGSVWSVGATVKPDESSKVNFEVTESASKYDVRVLAKSSTDTISQDVTTVDMAKSPTGLIYYVDVATTTLTDGGWGRMYGSAQSIFDQAHGADPVTGLKWGYTKRGSADYKDEDPFSSICHGDDSTTEYKFTMPKEGNYTVTVGTFRPQGWGTRTMNINITGGAKVGSGSMEAKEKISSIKAFDIGKVNANGEVTVTITKAGGVSLIIITETGTSIPVLAYGKSNYTMNGKYDHSGVGDGQSLYLGDDFNKAAGESFQVVMSDGNKKTYTLANGGLKKVSSELTKASVGETYSVIYKIQNGSSGETWDPLWPEMTVYYQFGIAAFEPNTRDGLYYFIDAATDGTYWKSHVFVRGEKQTDDNVYDQEYSDAKGWGYIGSGTAPRYNNEAYTGSIREMPDGTGYKMTGLDVKEYSVDIGMDCKNWGYRVADVYCNGTKVGSIAMENNGGCKIETFKMTPNASKVLEITFKNADKNNYGQPQLAFIRVYDDRYDPDASTTLDPLPAIKVNKGAVFRFDNDHYDGTLLLSGLKVGATVYVMDSNEQLVDSFKVAATDLTEGKYTWEIPDDVKNDKSVYGLSFVQAERQCVSGSVEAVVALPVIEITSDSKTVVAGDKIAIVVSPKLGKIPKEVYGSIDALTIKRPDDVVADILGSFFYRTIKNGKHTITVVCNGETYTKEITVNAIDEITMTATYTPDTWTTGSVTITIKPECKTTGSGIKEVYVTTKGVDYPAEKVTLKSDGTYDIVATENTTYLVKVVTERGSVKEYSYPINNIDKSQVQLSMNINFGASGGVQFNYKGTSGSEGKLWVKYNDGAPQYVDSLNTFTALEAGKYEFYYKSGTDEQSQTFTYYVTTDKANAHLANVSVASDGTVNVSGTGVTHKLYRAGSSYALLDPNVANAGKYYLELTNASSGEKEVVVIDTAEGSTVNNISVAQPTAPKAQKGGSNSTDTALTVIFVILAVAAVAGTVVVIIKRRKA